MLMIDNHDYLSLTFIFVTYSSLENFPVVKGCIAQVFTSSFIQLSQEKNHWLFFKPMAIRFKTLWLLIFT